MSDFLGLKWQQNKKTDTFRRAMQITLWAVLILWRLPFVFKGIDYTDTGFDLTNYMQVFDGQGIHDIGLFLTNLLGGVIYHFLPAYHLLVFRLLYWFLCVGIDAIAYVIFRKHMKPALVLGALIIYDFASFGGEALLSYYPLTKIFLLSALALLFSGIEKGKPVRIVFSGVLCGINTFVRLPNGLFCVMFVGIIAYGFWTKQEKKRIFKGVFQYILGAIAGVLLILAVMILYMGINGVVDSFMEYVNLALGKSGSETVNFLEIEESSGHSLFAIVKTVGRQVVSSIRDMAIFGLPMLGAAVLLSQLKRLNIRFAGVFSFVICVVAEAIIAVVFRVQMRSTIGYISAILMMVICLFMVFALKGKLPAHRMIYLVAFLLGCCCVFGSDLGLARINMLQGVIPLAIVMGILDIKEVQVISGESKKAVFIYKNILCNILIILFVVMFVAGTTVGMKTAYMDGDYVELKSSVIANIPVLQGMKTSDIRAEELNEYYEIMSDPALAASEVSIFGYFPLGYVIGPQRDYFESVQPCVDYTSVSVTSLLEVIEKKQNDRVYPIIVLSHINKLQRGDDHDTSDAKLTVMRYMLTLTDYQVLVDDDYYLIYVPNSLVV
ncbi:MAG: hypothetical protein IJH32_08630 [Ruminococcus sp.]|nr:hypothetical protein [Ruminococcus sp.]